MGKLSFPSFRRGWVYRPTLTSERQPDRFTGTLAPHERAEIDHTLSVTAIGSTDTVHAAIAALVARTGADELIMVSQIYDHAARLRSYELTAALRDRVASQTANALRQG